MQRILQMTKVKPAEIQVFHHHPTSSDPNSLQQSQATSSLPMQVSELQFSESITVSNKFVPLVGKVDNLVASVVIPEQQNGSGDQAGKDSKLSNSFLGTKMDQLRTSVKDIPKRMGSWTQFFDPKLFSLPKSGGQLYERLRGNLQAFYPNYCVISLILLAYCLFTSPLLLIGLTVFGLLAYNILTRNQDLSLWGQTFNRNQQLIGLSVCSIPLFLLLGLTGVFFWLIGASVCITGLHSVFHQTPQLVQSADNAQSGLSGDVGQEDRKNGGTFQVITL